MCFPESAAVLDFQARFEAVIKTNRNKNKRLNINNKVLKVLVMLNKQK